MEKKYVKNGYGIRINMGCYSCGNCTGHYKCNLTKSRVPRDYWCTCWKMKPHLHNAGKGDGIVKPKELLFDKLGLCGTV